MALTTAQYRTMRDLFRGALSVDSANPTDADVLTFFKRFLVDSAAAGALGSRQFLADEIARGILSGNFSNPTDADVISFWTQLAADGAAGATMGTTAQYIAMKRSLLGSFSKDSFNPTQADIYKYFSNYSVPYMGQVATRCGIPDTIIGTASPLMQRFATYARDNITSMKIAWANWVGDEQDPASIMTITASVEYPAGVFTQCLFGGLVTGTAPTKTTIYCDTVTIAGGIPNGALFWVRFFQTGTASYLGSSVAKPNFALGEAQTFPGTDQTMGGTVVSNINGLAVPCSIIGLTTKRSVAIIGDSRQAGASDNFSTVLGNYGTVAHGIGQSYGYTNLGVSGKTTTSFLAAHALRDDLIQYCSDVVNALGVNDVFVSGLTSAALQTNLGTIRALYPTKRYIVTTLDPETTSIDQWVTTYNQTVRAQEAVRVSFNGAVRANALGYDGYLDCSAITELGATGKWKVDGITPLKYTVDGTHHSPFAYALFDGAFTLP
jgi:lysophospholipase L1-like esterase